MYFPLAAKFTMPRSPKGADYLSLILFNFPPHLAPYTQNARYCGGSVTPDPRDQARGWLRAIDAATGEEHWAQQWPTPLVAAVTATSGGVLFTGDLDNNFVAIDAANGKALYKFNTGGSLGGGVLSYAIGDKQFVATTSGVVSGFFFGGTDNATIVICPSRRLGSPDFTTRHPITSSGSSSPARNGA